MEACSDCFSAKAVARVRIEDFPASSMVVTTFAPFTEIARADDLERLLHPVTIDPATAARPPQR